MGILRQTLKIAGPLGKSAPFVETFLQPVINKVKFPAPLLPYRVAITRATINGVPGEWLLPLDADGDKPPKTGSADQRHERVLLWAHGGAFVLCSPGTHRLFLAKAAASSGVPIFCVDYRKPPAHPFPTPGNDVLSVFRGLREHASDRVFIGGDSAGGNLALTTANSLVASGVDTDRPEGVVLLSPWVDLADTSSESWHDSVDSDFLPPDHVDDVARMYSMEMPLEDARLSPVHCGDMSALPPVLLDYGSKEVLRSQIQQLEIALRRDGVDVLSTKAQDMVHVYPLFELLWYPGDPKLFNEYYQRLAKFLSLPKVAT